MRHVKKINLHNILNTELDNNKALGKKCPTTKLVLYFGTNNKVNLVKWSGV